MTIPTWRARGRAYTLSVLVAALPVAASEAAVLAAFDFDLPGGGFELAPEILHPALTAAAFSDAAGTLTDFAGVSGRALAASAFTSGNTITLSLQVTPGQRVQLAQASFALRVSASGPNAWELHLGETLVGSGAAGTGFAHFDVDLSPFTTTGDFALVWSGSGATSPSGTLRLDDVSVFGTVSAVPVQPALALVLLPLAGLLRHRQPAQPR